MILLDTDVCIELLHGNTNVLRKREAEHDALAISLMTGAELYYGASKSNKPVHNCAIVESFLLTLYIIHSDPEILKKFGEVKTQLERDGFPANDADVFIAATAITKCEKLVTGNIKHFQNIEELRIENWIR